MMCLRGVRLFVACYDCIILSRSNYDSMSYFYVLNCFSSPDCWSERKKNPSVLHQMSNQSYWAYIYCFHWFLRNLFVLATMNRLVVERKVEKISRTSKTMKIMNIGQAAGKKIWNDSIYCMFESREIGWWCDGGVGIWMKSKNYEKLDHTKESHTKQNKITIVYRSPVSMIIFIY